MPPRRLIFRPAQVIHTKHCHAAGPEKSKTGFSATVREISIRRPPLSNSPRRSHSPRTIPKSLQPLSCRPRNRPRNINLLRCASFYSVKRIKLRILYLLSFFPSFHYKFPNLFRRYSSPVFSRPKPHILTKSSLNLQTKFQFAPTPSATFRLPHPSYTGPLHHSPPRPVPLSTKLESTLIEPFPPIPMSFSLLIAY